MATTETSIYSTFSVEMCPRVNGEITSVACLIPTNREATVLG